MFVCDNFKLFLPSCLLFRVPIVILSGKTLFQSQINSFFLFVYICLFVCVCVCIRVSEDNNNWGYLFWCVCVFGGDVTCLPSLCVCLLSGERIDSQ